MNTLRTRIDTASAEGSDEGSVTPFVLVIFIALMLAIGLVVDGAGRIHALATADTAAQEAARAAGQTMSPDTLVQGAALTIDTAAAARAARSYLAAAGVRGTVNVTGQTITVNTTVHYTPRMLAGIAAADLTGHAVARPARGITQETR